MTVQHRINDFLDFYDSKLQYIWSSEWIHGEISMKQLLFKLKLWICTFETIKFWRKFSYFVNRKKSLYAFLPKKCTQFFYGFLCFLWRKKNPKQNIKPWIIECLFTFRWIHICSTRTCFVNFRFLFIFLWTVFEHFFRNFCSFYTLFEE